MRICVITSAAFPPEEGIGNFITNMSMEFLRKGHSVTVITRGKPGKTEVTDFQGIKLYKAPFLPLYPFHVQIHGIFAKRLIKSIEQDIDVVHYHTPLPPAIKVRPPVLTTVHTPMKTDTGKVELINPFSVAVKLQGKISCLIEKNLFRISTSHCRRHIRFPRARRVRPEPEKCRGHRKRRRRKSLQACLKEGQREIPSIYRQAKLQKRALGLHRVRKNHMR